MANASALRAFHASNSYMPTPPKEFRPFRSMDFGPGFYMATDCEDALRYGPHVHEADVRLDNPVVMSNKGFDPALLAWFKKALHIDDDSLSFYKNPIVGVFDLAKTLVDVGQISPASLVRALQKKGYDGILAEADVIAAHFPEMKRTRGAYVAIWAPDQILSWRNCDMPARLASGAMP